MLYSGGCNAEGPVGPPRGGHDCCRRRFVFCRVGCRMGMNTVIETRLASAPYKGFPIVSADGSHTLLGYIERTEVRWVIGMYLLCLSIYFALTRSRR
jgi:hypothetical protein